MLRYLVAEIAGKQYRVSPDQNIIVDSLGDVKNFECDKVLLIAEDTGLQIGTPYVKTKIVFDVVAQGQTKKIRVAKFHAKANTRKVTGARKKITTVKLAKV